MLTDDLTDRIQVTNSEEPLTDEAISAMARLLIAMADVESEDAQENMEADHRAAGWRKNC